MRIAFSFTGNIIGIHAFQSGNVKGVVHWVSRSEANSDGNAKSSFGKALRRARGAKPCGIWLVTHPFKPGQQTGRASNLGNLRAVTGMHAHNRQHNESAGQHKQAEKYEAR
jgi:hypothetical protein